MFASGDASLGYVIAAISGGRWNKVLVLARMKKAGDGLVVMGRLNKLPGGVKYPSHREWKLLKKLPRWWLLGTLVFATPLVHAWWTHPQMFNQDLERLSLFLGLLFTFWFFIGATMIGLVVIIIMKGPGYVSDPYYLPVEDKSLESQLDKQ